VGENVRRCFCSCSGRREGGREGLCFSYRRFIMSVNILRLLSTEEARTMDLIPLMPTAEITASAGKVSSPHLGAGREGGRGGGGGGAGGHLFGQSPNPSLPPSLPPFLPSSPLQEYTGHCPTRITVVSFALCLTTRVT